MLSVKNRKKNEVIKVYRSLGKLKMRINTSEKKEEEKKKERTSQKIQTTAGTNANIPLNLPQNTITTEVCMDEEHLSCTLENMRLCLS